MFEEVLVFAYFICGYLKYLEAIPTTLKKIILIICSDINKIIQKKILRELDDNLFDLFDKLGMDINNSEVIEVIEVIDVLDLIIEEIIKVA